jgi:MoaA/NifB/PqqE/SkfB family radical SAM enzyme
MKVFSHMFRRAFRTTANNLLNETEFQLRSKRLLSSPRIVDVVISYACDANCIFCQFRDNRKPAFISIHDFQKIAFLFKTASEIRFCSCGEPYMHPQFIDLCRLTKKETDLLQVLSNGMLLTESSSETIIGEHLVAGHGFSYDGYKDETMSAIRRGIDPARVKKNIAFFLRLKTSLKVPIRTTIRYALMRRNLNELPDAIDYWGDRGIDLFDCNYLLITRDTSPSDSVHDISNDVKKVFEVCMEKSARYPHMTLNLPQLTSIEVPVQKCKYPWIFLMVDTEGCAYPCYVAWPMHYFGILKNMEKGSFQTVWNSLKWRELRTNCNSVPQSNSLHQCSRCVMRLGYKKFENHILPHCEDPWPFLNSENQGSGV